jgi:hypothetical protein
MSDAANSPGEMTVDQLDAHIDMTNRLLWGLLNMELYGE